MRGRGVDHCKPMALSTLDETQIDTVARVYSSAMLIVDGCCCVLFVSRIITLRVDMSQNSQPRENHRTSQVRGIPTGAK